MKARLQTLLLSLFTTLGRKLLGLSTQLWKDLSIRIDSLDDDETLTQEQRHEKATAWLRNQIIRNLPFQLGTSAPPTITRADGLKRAIQLAVLIRRFQRWFLPPTDATTSAV